MTKTYKKGFTLIELLVVIAIIGILSTLAVVSLGNARTKARDAKVLSDIRSTQSALEIFYTDQGYYPPASASGCLTATTLEGCCLDDGTTPGWKVTGNCGTTGLITVPNNPQSGASGSVVPNYIYAVSGSDITKPTSYSVNFQLETPASPMKKFNCLTTAGMTGDVNPATDGNNNCSD